MQVGQEADPQTLEELEASRRVILRYCDDEGQVSSPLKWLSRATSVGV